MEMVISLRMRRARPAITKLTSATRPLVMIIYNSRITNQVPDKTEPESKLSIPGVLNRSQLVEGKIYKR